MSIEKYLCATNCHLHNEERDNSYEPLEMCLYPLPSTFYRVILIKDGFGINTDITIMIPWRFLGLDE